MELGGSPGASSAEINGDTKGIPSMDGDGESEKVSSEGTRKLVVLELAVILVETRLKSDISMTEGDEALEFAEDDVDDSESAGLLVWSGARGKSSDRHAAFQ